MCVLLLTFAFVSLTPSALFFFWFSWTIYSCARCVQSSPLLLFLSVYTFTSRSFAVMIYLAVPLALVVVCPRCDLILYVPNLFVPSWYNVRAYLSRRRYFRIVHQV